MQEERKKWSLAEYEKHLLTLKDEPAFYLIGIILEKAQILKEWDKVTYYAILYLQKAKNYKNSWNYGNAIYYSYLVLSEDAYNKGDKVLARNLLIRAAKTPGSKQLKIFGPFGSTQLAYFKRLARENEREILILFAKYCKIFVSTDIVSKSDKEVAQWNLDRIDRFISQLQNDELPDFKSSQMPKKIRSFCKTENSEKSKQRRKLTISS